MTTSALVLPLGVSIFFVLGCAILVLMISVDYSFSAARSFAMSHASVIAATGQSHIKRHFTYGAVLKHQGIYHGFLSGRHPNPSNTNDTETRLDAFNQAVSAFYGSVSTSDLSFEVPYTPSITFADGSYVTCFNGRLYDETTESANTEEIIIAEPFSKHAEGVPVYCSVYNTLDLGGAGNTPRTNQTVYKDHVAVSFKTTFSDPNTLGTENLPINRHTYVKCPRGAKEDPYFTDVFIHPDRLDPALGVCGPLYYNGEFVGISHSAIHLDTLAATLASIPKSANSLLVVVDNRGFVTATSDLSKSAFETHAMPTRPATVPSNCEWARGYLVCRYIAAEMPNFSLVNRLALEKPSLFSVMSYNDSRPLYTTTTPDPSSTATTTTAAPTAADQAYVGMGPEDLPVSSVKVGQDTYYCSSVMIDVGTTESPLRWRLIVAVPDNDVTSSIKKGRDIGFVVVAAVVVAAIAICGITLWILLKQARDSRNSDNNLDEDAENGEEDTEEMSGGKDLTSKSRSTGDGSSSSPRSHGRGATSTSGTRTDQSTSGGNTTDEPKRSTDEDYEDEDEDGYYDDEGEEGGGAEEDGPSYDINPNDMAVPRHASNNKKAATMGGASDQQSYSNSAGGATNSMARNGSTVTAATNFTGAGTLGTNNNTHNTHHQSSSENTNRNPSTPSVRMASTSQYTAHSGHGNNNNTNNTMNTNNGVVNGIVVASGGQPTEQQPHAHEMEVFSPRDNDDEQRRRDEANEEGVEMQQQPMNPFAPRVGMSQQ